MPAASLLVPVEYADNYPHLVPTHLDYSNVFYVVLSLKGIGAKWVGQTAASIQDHMMVVMKDMYQLSIVY